MSHLKGRRKKWNEVEKSAGEEAVNTYKSRQIQKKGEKRFRAAYDVTSLSRLISRTSQNSETKTSDPFAE